MFSDFPCFFTNFTYKKDQWRCREKIAKPIMGQSNPTIPSTKEMFVEIE